MREIGLDQTPEREITSTFLDKQVKKTTRRFINSAIYVEKPATFSISTESFATRTSSSDDSEVKTKRCTCASDQKSCVFHVNNVLISPRRDQTENSVPVKNVERNKTKISMVSPNVRMLDEKKRFVKKWTVKKEEGKTKKDLETKIILEEKLKEKQLLLEEQKKNFKRWLANKTKMEAEAKKKKEREMQEQQLRELEKEKRQLENQLNFQLWLKKKQEALLEKKIKKQIEVINELESKEKQLKENEKAFNEWLKNSKNRQKPIPLNRGLESLCSSTSVTYVNPNPWNPAT